MPFGHCVIDAPHGFNKRFLIRHQVQSEICHLLTQILLGAEQIGFCFFDCGHCFDATELDLDRIAHPVGKCHSVLGHLLFNPLQLPF
ncbi:hypothetical protein D7Y42_02155 [Stenotrophomonas maltophilia]|nr:hypothetical protein [Stenotrophomonas maltophilia]